MRLATQVVGSAPSTPRLKTGRTKTSSSTCPPWSVNKPSACKTLKILRRHSPCIAVNPQVEAFHAHLQRSDCYYDCMQVGRHVQTISVPMCAPMLQNFSEAVELYPHLSEFLDPIMLFPQNYPIFCECMKVGGAGSLSDRALHVTPGLPSCQDTHVAARWALKERQLMGNTARKVSVALSRQCRVHSPCATRDQAKEFADECHRRWDGGKKASTTRGLPGLRRLLVRAHDTPGRQC